MNSHQRGELAYNRAAATGRRPDKFEVSTSDIQSNRRNLRHNATATYKVGRQNKFWNSAEASNTRQFTTRAGSRQAIETPGINRYHYQKGRPSNYAMDTAMYGTIGATTAGSAVWAGRNHDQEMARQRAAHRRKLNKVSKAYDPSKDERKLKLARQIGVAGSVASLGSGTVVAVGMGRGMLNPRLLKDTVKVYQSAPRAAGRYAKGAAYGVSPNKATRAKGASLRSRAGDFPGLKSPGAAHLAAAGGLYGLGSTSSIGGALYAEKKTQDMRAKRAAELRHAQVSKACLLYTSPSPRD